MNMNAQQILIMVLIGIVAGWLASMVVGGPGTVLGYLICGVIGAFVGSFVFSAAGWSMNLGNPILNQIVIAFDRCHDRDRAGKADLALVSASPRRS